MIYVGDVKKLNIDRKTSFQKILQKLILQKLLKLTRCGETCCKNIGYCKTVLSMIYW